MAYDFPASPTLGQQFTAAAGTIYVWNGYAWVTPAGGGSLSIAVQTFTASGTYTPRAGMQFCIVEAVGGGGAGGGCVSAANNLSAAGGGGAGYSRKYATAAQIGASQTVTIGAGGVGVSAATGGNGGDTSVGSLCIAKGGSGGVGATTASYPSPAGGAGGVAGTGDVTVAGTPGMNGNFMSSGQGLVAVSNGGPGPLGGGGLGSVGVIGAGAGQNANGYGAGGGGSICNTSGAASIGGNGSAGIVIITEYVLTGGTAATAVSMPQGRLTLQTATPVMTTTQAAKTTIYYTPYQGNLCPIYDGTNFNMSAFTELSVLTTDTTKSPAAIGVSKVNDWFLWNDAGTLRIGHGPDWTNDTTRSAGTALVRVSGTLLNAVALTNGPAASRGTYVGTTRSNASSQLDWIFGTIAAGGGTAFLNVWNCYNRVDVNTIVSDNTDSWSYSSATWRAANGNTNNSVIFVQGLAEDFVTAYYHAIAGVGGGTGVALNTISGFFGMAIVCNSVGPIFLGAGSGGGTATVLGANIFYAIESIYTASACLFYGDAGIPASFQTGLVFCGRF